MAEKWQPNGFIDWLGVIYVVATLIAICYCFAITTGEALVKSVCYVIKRLKNGSR